MIPMEKVEALIHLFEENQKEWEDRLSDDTMESCEDIEAESAIETYDFVIAQLKQLMTIENF